MSPVCTDNLTAVLYKAEDLRLEKRCIPEPKYGEVLIKMACVGICGSDVHYLVHGSIGNFVVRSPMVIGHEASGIIARVGEGVTSLKEGDRVAIEPGVSCRLCTFCKEGKYNLCRDMKFCATPPYDGNLCQYYIHAADFCFKLPDHVSLEEGALLEPLSVGVHACRRANVNVNTGVLILGSGPIGLVTSLVAKAMGAKYTIITDLVPHRLTVAKKLGADYILKVGKDEPDEEVARKVEELIGDKPEVTIDCSGFESTIKVALQATKSGGMIILVGMGADEVKIPLLDAAVREVDIRGVFRYCNDYPLALSLVATGKVDVKPLITHKYKLENTLEAFETARTGTGNPIKVMIYCN